MAIEEWARGIVEKELKQPVILNDDNSVPSMYDLRVGPIDKPDMAIECIGAVDADFAETWNIGPAKGPIKLSINSDWNVEITPKTRIKTVKQHIESLLMDLEYRGIENVDADHWLQRGDSVLYDKLKSLGITHLSCFRHQGSGIVHLHLPGICDMVDSYGQAIPEWVGEFLIDSQRSDVIKKLNISGAIERHVFIYVTFYGASSSVELYLSENIEQLRLSHNPIYQLSNHKRRHI